MIIIAILAVAAVVGLLYWASTEQNGLYTTTNSIFGNAINSIQSGVQSGVQGLYKLKEDYNEAGDSVAFFAPKDVIQQIDSIASTQPTQDNQEPAAQDAQYYENGTAIPNTSYVTGIVADTSYSKTGTKQIQEKVGDNKQMLVQIGNIATIQGQIKIIKNPETGELVEPRIYKYYLTIDCNESVTFCTMTPLSTYGTTNVGGTFLYKWVTDGVKHTPGLYDVRVYAESETKNPEGQKYSVEGLLQIELYK